MRGCLCRETHTTKVVWTVGRVGQFSLGKVYTQTVKTGPYEWRLSFYPKGLTDAEWASLYVTSLDCERNKEGATAVQATLQVAFRAERAGGKSVAKPPRVPGTRVLPMGAARPRCEQASCMLARTRHSVQTPLHWRVRGKVWKGLRRTSETARGGAFKRQHAGPLSSENTRGL